MSESINFYDGAYSKFADKVLADIRAETYGNDLGQSSWITEDEYDRFCQLVNIGIDSHVLETASGSGGPALYMAQKHGCSVVGIDINQDGIDNANKLAAAKRISNASFQLTDVQMPLPFDDESFDAVICTDAANHFPDRLHVLSEWARVLRPGGRILFTDPVVITGPVTNHELFNRSSIGTFVFIPIEVTERFIHDAGLALVEREDVTANVVATSGRWHAARAKRRDVLVELEGEDSFNGLQTFLYTVYKLTNERRVSRFAFLAEK